MPPALVELSAKLNNNMGHIQEFEKELRERLAKGPSDELVKWLKGKMLQSYANGIAVGEKGGPRRPSRSNYQR